MFIDVHCHLDVLKDIPGSIEKAIKSNVKIILAHGVNSATNRKVLDLSSRFKEVKAALGIYPIDALKMSDEEIEQEIEFILKNKSRIAAIGEVGIDFKEDGDNKERQKRIFEKFIKLANELNKPIIVHSRKAEKECVEILENSNIKKVIMHCFSGKFSLVQRIIGNGWFLSIPTNVIYSEQFQENVRKIDIKNLLCETDAPYLHPQRKGENEPVNVIESYKKIAELKGLPLKEVEKRIEENYYSLFNQD